MEPSAPVDPRRVDAFVTRVLGGVEQLAVHTRQFGRVIEVRDTGGARWIVKTTPSQPAFRRERFAYRQWVPQLADQAPRLRAAQAALRTLIVEHLPGEARWTFESEHHRDAGRLLRRLHDAAPPTSHGPTVAHLAAQRLRLALRQFDETTLSAAEREFALAAVPELRHRSAGLPRVPCHGDYGGHNWLRGPDGLSVIDFSTSRRSAAMSDWTRLFAGPWWSRPHLAEAFFDGYGRQMLEQEAACVRAHLRVFTVFHVALGKRKGEPLLEQRGRERLHDLMNDRGPLAPPRTRWRTLRRTRPRNRDTPGT